MFAEPINHRKKRVAHLRSDPEKPLLLRKNQARGKQPYRKKNRTPVVRPTEPPFRFIIQHMPPLRAELQRDMFPHEVLAAQRRGDEKNYLRSSSGELSGLSLRCWYQ